MNNGAVAVDDNDDDNSLIIWYNCTCQNKFKTFYTNLLHNRHEPWKPLRKCSRLLVLHLSIYTTQKLTHCLCHCNFHKKGKTGKQAQILETSLVTSLLSTEQTSVDYIIKGR